MVAVVWHASAGGGLPAPETAITERDIQKQNRDRGDKVKSEDAGHAGKIRERDEGELGAERERNIKPGAGDPGFGRVQRPQRARHRSDDRAADHEQQLATEVRIFVSQDEKELAREKVSCGDDRETERGHRAENAGVLQAKSCRVLAARERGRENVGEEMAQDGEDHGEPAERADFGDRTDLPTKNADQENGDLALKTKEDCIRRLPADEAEHGRPIVGVLGRGEIDDARHVTTQHPVLENEGGGADSQRDGAIQKQIHQRGQGQETRDGAGEINRLNPADVRSKSRHDTEDADGKLNGETSKDSDDEKSGVVRRRPILDEQVIENRDNDDHRDQPELPAQTERRVDELPKAMAVLPDAAADGDQPNADADVREDVQRPLHRVRDGEVGVFALIEMPNQEDTAEETDDLDDGLDESEITHDPRAMERPPDDRRGGLVQDRRRNRAEETHREISRDAGPAEIAVRKSERALGRLNLSRLVMPMRGGHVVGFFHGQRRVVILRILVVIIFRQRGIDVIQNNAGHVDLAVVKELERFADEPRGSVREPDHEQARVDLAREAGGLVRYQY